MSATSPSDVDLREQLARIDNILSENRKLSAETLKLFAEQEKLLAEARKLPAEQDKLWAEARKFGRERVLSTLLALTGLLGGIVIVVQLVWRVRGGG